VVVDASFNPVYEEKRFRYFCANERNAGRHQVLDIRQRGTPTVLTIFLRHHCGFFQFVISNLGQHNIVLPLIHQYDRKKLKI
jgi:hypothetical protein